jgi:hypothetical protein
LKNGFVYYLPFFFCLRRLLAILYACARSKPICQHAWLCECAMIITYDEVKRCKNIEMHFFECSSEYAEYLLDLLAPRHNRWKSSAAVCCVAVQLLPRPDGSLHRVSHHHKYDFLRSFLVFMSDLASVISTSFLLEICCSLLGSKKGKNSY